MTPEAEDGAEQIVLNPPSINRGPSVYEMAWMIVASYASGQNVGFQFGSEQVPRRVQKRVAEIMRELESQES